MKSVRSSVCESLFVCRPGYTQETLGPGDKLNGQHTIRNVGTTSNCPCWTVRDG